MKIHLITGLFILSVAVSGQDTMYTHPANSYQFIPNSPIRAKLILTNGKRLKVSISKIYDQEVEILANTADSTPPVRKLIPVAVIRKIRVKRNAVRMGMTQGALITGIAGYGVGYIAYDADDSQSDEDIASGRQVLAIMGAAAGAVPGAVVGGFVGGVVIKRRFKIKGDPGRMIKLIKALHHQRSWFKFLASNPN